jgi:hypothetical protein
MYSQQRFQQPSHNLQYTSDLNNTKTSYSKRKDKKDHTDNRQSDEEKYLHMKRDNSGSVYNQPQFTSTSKKQSEHKEIEA